MKTVLFYNQSPNQQLWSAQTMNWLISLIVIKKPYTCSLSFGFQYLEKLVQVHIEKPLEHRPNNLPPKILVIKLF